MNSNAVDPARLRATVEKLASWPTRNTNTPQLDEAAEWLAGEFRKLPGMRVEIMRYRVEKSPRVPETKEVAQVVATLPGEVDNRIVIGGHMDSLNLREEIATGRAPGANDDASGVASTLELARAMSAQKWKRTLVFVAFSGEEQGLLGAKALARRAREENWRIDAVLNNDTVGSSGNLVGERDPKRVRVFSEDKETHDSRELARWMEWLVRERGPEGFGIKLVFRRDRFGRGGDHTPFNNEGFTAVRLVEPHEEYTRQHTREDLPEYLDYEYLANVTRVNLTVAGALAQADDPPTEVRVDRRQSHDSTISWQGRPGTSYVVYWRDTTSPTWQGFKEVGGAEKVTLALDKDANVFAVGAVGGLPVEAR